MSIQPVIMCGGAGSRLWPMSRKAKPKQFLSLTGPESLLEATVARLAMSATSASDSPPLVICGKGQEGLVAEQLAAAGRAEGAAIIVEPIGRNTAAVAAVASLAAMKEGSDSLVLLLPADHYIADEAGFWRGVEAGIPAAEEGYLVTLGIEPTGPETGYGYIKRGNALGTQVYSVDRFVEKPDAVTAATYIEAGDYFWNAGIFLFRASAMIAAFEQYAPDILAACRQAYEGGVSDKQVIYLNADAFASSPSEPVDIAIMERSDRVAVVAPVRAEWNDVGSWTSIADLTQTASDSTQIIELDCRNCLIQTDGPMVAAIGLEDLVVVATEDAILITRRDQTQKVKNVVELLKERQRSDLL